MGRKQFIAIAIFASLTAFGGAFMSSYFIERSEAAGQHMYFDSVTSRQFRLVDTTGKWRGEISLDARGPALFMLSDPQGRVGLRIGVNNNGTAFIQDSSGRSFGGSGHGPNLPPTQWVPRPGGAGKGDSASQADARVMRDEISALWQQISVIKERVDVLSQSPR